MAEEIQAWRDNETHLQKILREIDQQSASKVGQQDNRLKFLNHDHQGRIRKSCETEKLARALNERKVKWRFPKEAN